MGDNQRKSKRQRAAEAVPLYRDRTKKLQEFGRHEDVGEINRHLREDLLISKEYYPVVKKQLDGSRADSKHLREVLHLGHETSRRIKISNKSIDFARFLNSEVANRPLANFAEFFFHEYAQDCIARSPHIVECIENGKKYDPQQPGISNQQQQQQLPQQQRLPGDDLAPRAKKSRIILEGENKISAKERTTQADDEDMTSKQVVVIERELKRITDRRPVNFFEALVDPESFPGTVENFFHSSFLLKEGKVGLRRDGSKPLLETKTATEGDTKQSILSFTLSDYKKWIAALDIREAALDRSLPLEPGPEDV